MISRFPSILSVCACLMASSIFAQESFPKEGWDKNLKALSSEWAVPGGKITEFGHQYPKSFNYTIENYMGTREIFQLMFETLLDMDPITYEEIPNVARRWEISEDKKTFTFHISEKAKWSDGKDITADDVVYSFHALKNPKHRTGQTQTILSRLTECKALDAKTVQITAKEVHWKNLQAAASIYVLPKHWWEKQDFNDVHFEFPVVSGRYELGEVKEPHFARLEKRKDYWNADAEEYEGWYNFDTIEFRFYSSQENAFEALKKGDLDFFAVYTSSRWVKETVGERFDKNWIAKQKVYNRKPIGFQGIAMNQRRAPYEDVKVRKAMALMIDRERMNNDLMFKQYELQNSYYTDLWTKDNPCPNPMIEFNVEKAKKLLAEAGWKQNPKSGKLEKDGQQFVARFLTRDASSNKFLFIYEEALNDAGIDMKIDQKDHSAWSKDLDEFNFDLLWMPWSSIPLKDPEPMWHSKTKDVKQGANIVGYGNPEVDKMIESLSTIFDPQERHATVRKIDELLVADSPYVLLWNTQSIRLLYWNKFGMPDQVLHSYEDHGSAKWLWWIDPDQEADLEGAQANGTPLPKPPAVVKFDETFEAPE